MKIHGCFSFPLHQHDEFQDENLLIEMLLHREWLCETHECMRLIKWIINGVHEYGKYTELDTKYTRVKKKHFNQRAFLILERYNYVDKQYVIISISHLTI